jgi:hypothetical protein
MMTTLSSSQLSSSFRDHLVFQVEERTGRGKCVVAKEHILEGTLCGTFRPIVPPVQFRDTRKTNCAVCFEKLESNSSSSIHLSKHAKYPVVICSEMCRKSNHSWIEHETSLVLSMLNEELRECVHAEILPTAILVFRLIEAVSKGTVTWSELLGMQTHNLLQENSCSPEVIHRQAILRLVLALLSKADICINHHLTLNQVEHLADRIKFNAFSMINEDGIELGFALFEAPSYRINHSCRPNLRHSFAFMKSQMPLLIIRASQSIRPEEEVCISYLANLEDSIEKRRERLMKDYRFLCQCQRCISKDGR